MDHSKTTNALCRFIHEEIITKMTSDELTQGLLWGALSANKPAIQAKLESGALDALGFRDKESMKRFFDAFFDKVPTAKISLKDLAEGALGVQLNGPMAERFLGGTISLTKKDADKFLSYIDD